MAKTERVCPECGSDRWRMRDAERLADRSYRAIANAEKLARDNGLLAYQRDEAKAEARDHTSRLQRKIVKQARVIVRLEKRLRDLNQKPYEGAGFDTAPGADADAAQVLPEDKAA